MADVTTRDKIWIVTLAYLATENHSFQLRDLPIDDSERITAQRVWRVMEHFNLLKRPDDPKTWHRGPLGELLLYNYAINEKDIQWDNDLDQLYV